MMTRNERHVFKRKRKIIGPEPHRLATEKAGNGLNRFPLVPTRPYLITVTRGRVIGVGYEEDIGPCEKGKLYVDSDWAEAILERLESEKISAIHDDGITLIRFSGGLD
jgi:hypothetical protein